MAEVNPDTIHNEQRIAVGGFEMIIGNAGGINGGIHYLENGVNSGNGILTTLGVVSIIVGLGMDALAAKNFYLAWKNSRINKQ